ncbi:hypothetical protein ACF0H5_022072 [Mactra antiquata]
MDGGLMMEPELSQAVKIVLKYEIQSLLSRLSDAGEEYIVLTASTDDGTCGHLGSTKGEGFVQKSSLQSIKQDFLNFCTGKTKPDVPAYVVAAPSKPNRRKSTPRCKFSRSKPSDTADVSKPAEFTSNDEPSYHGDTTSALNFNEKSVGYSYTLDNEADLNAYSNGSDSMYNDKVVENPDISKVAPPFTWANDQAASAVLRNLTVNGNDHFVGGIKLESNFVESVTPVVDNNVANIPVLDHVPPSEYTLNNCESKGRVQSARKSRRKSRRAPVKIEKKAPSYDVKFGLNDSGAVYMNADGIKIEQTDTNAVFNVTSHPIEEHISTQNHTKVGSVKKVAKKQNLSNITDMKSAFEEIGNMAKCLICNKILANKNNRTFHWRSHVGDKRYSCDICNKAFTHPSNMRSHRKIHTDEKPFPCDLCERRFRRRDYLLQHLERFHYNPKAQSDKTLNDGELEVKTEENQLSELQA